MTNASLDGTAFIGGTSRDESFEGRNDAADDKLVERVVVAATVRLESAQQIVAARRAGSAVVVVLRPRARVAAVSVTARVGAAHQRRQTLVVVGHVQHVGVARTIRLVVADGRRCGAVVTGPRQRGVRRTRRTRCRPPPLSAARVRLRSCSVVELDCAAVLPLCVVDGGGMLSKRVFSGWHCTLIYVDVALRNLELRT